MCLLLLTQNWILVDGSFIECISLLVLQDQNDSLRMKSKFAIHQQAVLMDSVASRRTSDREELIAKKEHLLFPDNRSRLPVENFSILRQKWQIPLTQT